MITAELLERHDRPGPRYTSYPTVDFTDDFEPDDYEARLFVRRLAQMFDAYTDRRPGDRPTFSRAV